MFGMLKWYPPKNQFVSESDMFASPGLFVSYIGQLDVLEENSGLENSL